MMPLRAFRLGLLGALIRLLRALTGPYKALIMPLRALQAILSAL